MNRRINLFAVLALTSFAASAQAAIVPFTEHFSAGPSDWRDSGGAADLTWVAAGGPDGSSYASAEFSFANQGEGARPAVIRAHDEYGANGSSGGAFVGNWLAEGVTGFSVWVRHDAPAPLNFYARYADLDNSPAAASIEFVPVLPNTWTQLNFSIAYGTPNLVLEGPMLPSFYNTIFDEIGHVQIGAETPAALAGNPGTFTFDIDQPTLVPEPASILLLAAAGAALLRRRRTSN